MLLGVFVLRGVVAAFGVLPGLAALGVFDSTFVRDPNTGCREIDAFVGEVDLLKEAACLPEAGLSGSSFSSSREAESLAAGLVMELREGLALRLCFVAALPVVADLMLLLGIRGFEDIAMSGE